MIGEDPDEPVGIDVASGQCDPDPEARDVAHLGESAAEGGRQGGGAARLQHKLQPLEAEPHGGDDLGVIHGHDGVEQRRGEQIPAAVRTVLRRRFAGLPDDVRSTLEVAAVLGEPINVPVLAAALRHDEDQVADLEAQGLLGFKDRPAG